MTTATVSVDTGARPIEWASDAQRWFFEAGPQPTLLLGGLNSAKTFGACLKILNLAFTYPRSHIAVVRKTSKYLRKTTMQTFYAMLDPAHYAKGARNDNDGYLRLNNGTEIFFIHLDTPDSLTLLAGIELNFGFVDQVEEISATAWETLETRVGRWAYAEVPERLVKEHESSGHPWPWRTKSGKALPPPYLFATANPPGDELHWLFEHFSEDSDDWKTKWKYQGYQYRKTDTRENRFASKQNIDVLLSRDDAWVDRFVRGNWGRPEGCIFRVDPQSLIEPEPSLVARIRNMMRLGRALDHGDTAPTCCLWGAADGDSNLYIWQEYYQPGMTKTGKEYGISDHRRSITEMSRGLVFSSNLADPQIFYKSRNISGYAKRSQRWSIADEYRDRQLILEDTAIHWTEADNNEDATRSRLREYLKIDPNHKHPITGQIGAPHLYFIEATEDYPRGCDRVVAELKAAKRVQIGESNGRPIFSDERDPTIADHALDALRYYVVSHPAPTPGPQPLKRVHATATGNGGVTLMLPPIREMSVKKDRDNRRWRSRAGGY